MSSAPQRHDSQQTPKASAPSNCSLWQPARTTYSRKPGAWWHGRRVRLERPIYTVGGAVYRKGRIAKVVRKYGGLTLEGRKLYVTGVGYYKLSVDATENADFRRGDLKATNKPQSETPSPARNG